MAEYIELTEELTLSMRAGARAIFNTNKYRGMIYMSDVFSDSPKEIPYLQAAEILHMTSQKEPADVAPVQRWIPVKERVPERDGRYLCVYVFQNGYGMRFTAVLGYYSSDPEPHFQYEGSDGMGMKVTHWMPLPELPKEDA